MLALEIEYSNYLCQNALTINSYLSNLYHQSSYDEIDTEHHLVDHEHDMFLFELIESCEYWPGIEEVIQYEEKVKSYHRLEDLLLYIRRIAHLSKDNRIIFDDMSVKNAKLNHCQLEDSCLLSFHIDSINHTCEIKLSNVLLYEDKRVNKTYDVDCGTMLLKFIDVKSTDMKGIIDTQTPEVNTIYKWYMVEMPDHLYRFGLYVMVGNKSFLLDVTYKEMEVIMIN